MTWETHSPELCDVRRRVFVIEQKVPQEIEIDRFDPQVIHAIAEDREGRAIGTGRLSEDGKIGRIAVLKDWRGMGVGSAIVNTLIERAEATGMTPVYLHGQTRSMEFYEKLGFVAHGPEFLEAGIPHYKMTLV